MPTYTYIDKENHYQSITHRMEYSTGVICYCGLDMWRKPGNVAINWGGLKPSAQPEYPQDIQDLMNPNIVAERRETFSERHEKHEDLSS